MGFHMTFYLSYKFRLLLLFTLCLTVVGWATSNYFVGAIQEIPKAKDFIASFNKAIVLGKKEILTNEASVKKADLDNCPSTSPYLSKYTFFLFYKCCVNFLLDIYYRKVQKSEVYSLVKFHRMNIPV